MHTSQALTHLTTVPAPALSSNRLDALLSLGRGRPENQVKGRGQLVTKRQKLMQSRYQIRKRYLGSHAQHALQELLGLATQSGSISTVNISDIPGQRYIPSLYQKIYYFTFKDVFLSLLLCARVMFCLHAFLCAMCRQ